MSAFSVPCPSCGATASAVIDTRTAPRAVRRRRECYSCQSRFTTYETVAGNTECSNCNHLTQRLERAIGVLRGAVGRPAA